ncbi:MAG: hypothetical protein ACREFP_12690 [Acetobacteraceae bacterium]
MQHNRRILLVAFVVAASSSISAAAGGPGNPVPVTEVDGLCVAEDGSPTYDVRKDGTVDWGTFVGYLRYSESCLRCHEPDGAGSIYVPDLARRIKEIDFSRLTSDVTAGMKAVNTAEQLVMPSFANDRNVMCFIKKIYT